ncbi:MAG: M48 family metallopeptidase [Noviherbaspirillum sp.]
MPLTASYFDGLTSRRHRVFLAVEGGMARISGDVERDCPLADLRVSEASRHGPRIVTFPDGAHLEIEDQAGFAQLLARTGHRDTVVARLQQSWRATLLAAAGMALALLLLWRYALPLAAELIAAAVPATVEQALGESALQALDRRMLAPSTLAPAEQARISAQFAQLASLQGQASRYRLLFRKSRIGPNALALPSGQIVLTDELVRLLTDDSEALMGVLAHELGHLERRHLLRRIVHGAATGAAAMALFGDASGLVATLPALLLDLKYSRDAEFEADDYAAALMKASGLDPGRLALALQRLGGDEQHTAAYLSSHPATAERVERLRGGAPQ